MFLRPETILLYIWYEIENNVRKVNANRDHTADCNTDKRKCRLAGIKPIYNRINKREGFKEAIVRAVHKGRVDVGEQDGWILDADFQRLDEREDKYVAERLVFAVDFGL